MEVIQRNGRNTYVPALRDDPAPMQFVETNFREIPQAPISAPMPYASHKDRAVGFTVATGPLAGVVGLVAALVGILGWQVPIASLVTLLLALGGFAVTWLIAFALHVFVSADGALFLHVILAWRFLFLEGKERRKRYGTQKGLGL